MFTTKPMIPETTTELQSQNVTAITRDLILSMARALVDKIEAVDVQICEDGTSAAILLSVDYSDLGKIIGKEGRTVRSMRTVLQAAGMKQHKHYSLDVQAHPPG